MNRRRAVLLASIAGVALLLVVGAVVFISTGAYNIAATSPHTPLTRWILNTTQERSVAARADAMPEPPPVNSAMVQHGFEEYHEMCVVCHGAPGVERGALGKGMNPKPPDLAKEAVEWSDRELFWITKHGIKLAGMPAFGVTHSDEELWAIVAFLRRLQDMSAEEYRRLAAGAQPHGGMHQAEPELHAHMPSPDHAQMEHAPMATDRRPDVHTSGHAEMPAMKHDGMPARRRAPAQAAVEPARGEDEPTQKLKTLAAELVRDPVVLARIRTDSALRRQWDDENVRRQLAKPPH